MKQRSYALDALRGYAIVTMVLSGSIVFGILPGWMHHAQTPPPSHVFAPEIPGITWVDLVFPFFLFAMGAAFPFSIGKRLSDRVGRSKIIFDTTKRALKLVFFAIFIQHFYPWNLSNPQDMRSWLLAISCFILLFPMFMRMPFKASEWIHSGIRVAAFGIASLMLLFTNYAENREFDIYFSNIIILVLANMAFFGTIIYIFTAQSKLLRIAILLFLMAILLAKDTEGTLVQTIYTWTPAPWMYKFVFLKYLFIVLPGSIAGEYIYEWINKQNTENKISTNSIKRVSILLLSTSMLIIICNVICLYNRWLTVNFIITILLLYTSYWVLKGREDCYLKLWMQLFAPGAFLILLGLFFESYEGGIKKDPSTFSYYFTSTGLAFLAMMVFHIICDFYQYTKGASFLIMSGQNPMIAYVASNLLIVPLLNIMGVYSFFSIFQTNAYLAALQGIILTALTIAVTMLFTKIKWFWRT